MTNPKMFYRKENFMDEKDRPRRATVPGKKSKTDRDLVSSLKCYINTRRTSNPGRNLQQKCFLENIRRGIFEDGGDAGRGCNFRDPPLYLLGRFIPIHQAIAAFLLTFL